MLRYILFTNTDNMFKKLSTSYHLVKVSFQYIKQDGELLIYSILSLLASLAIFATFTGVGFIYLDELEALTSNTQGNETTTNILLYTAIFIYYLVFSFITFFFNTAIITSVQRRINGHDNKLWDGLRDSMKYVKQIFIWSLINALVSTILNFIQNSFNENSIIGKVIVGLVGGVWNVLTFFSFPLMILNGVWAKDAIKESGSLFKKTWGERAIIHVGVGLLFFFFFLALIILVGFIIFSWLFITGLVILILGALSLIILSSTCNVIIKTILLHYATHGSLPDGLENEQQIVDMAGIK